MREAIAEMLLDKTTGFFDWWNRADRVDLYQTGVGWPLLTTTINGFGTAAPWFQAFGKGRADTLFLALGHISRSWTGFSIKHQDDAYAEVNWATSRRLTRQWTCRSADRSRVLRSAGHRQRYAARTHEFET